MSSALDILDLSEVLDATLDSTDVPEDFAAQTLREIRDVQGRIAQYLGYDVMAHAHTEAIRRHDWTYDETASGTSATFRAALQEGPIVEVLSPSDVSVRFDGTQVTKDDREPVQVTYVAGYRRADQALSDLPTGSGEALDGLTVAPDALPADVRSVALRIVMARMVEVASGTLGRGREVAIGTNDLVRVEGTDPQFERRELAKLSSYKAFF
jgi:hypothetical protein